MPIPFRFPDDLAAKPRVVPGTATLDGRIYSLRFFPSVRANDGKGAWYVDLFTVLGTPSALGVKLILTTDLWKSFKTTDADVPPGRLVVRRTDGIDADPRPSTKADAAPTLVGTLGSPSLVVEYFTVAEDANG